MSPPTPKPAPSERSESRCPWAAHPDMHAYHDTEWGVPVHDDRRHFEFLILEGAQAGLSWSTILRRRAGYRRAFAAFEPRKVAKFTPADVARCLADPGIIRNRLKVESCVTNARAFLKLQEDEGTFDAFLWKFVEGRPVVNRWQSSKQVPPTSPVSDAVAKEMKRLGFRFAGSTIMYAHLQACGLVNDHLVACPRWKMVQTCKPGRSL